MARHHDPGLISPRGGTYTSPDGQVTVVFPPGAVGRAVRVRYGQPEKEGPEGSIAAGFFSLEAEEAAGGAPVTTFGAPLEVRVRYPETSLPPWLEQRLHLYYERGDGRWERLPSVAHPERNEVIAWTTHMSDFGLLADAGQNPCDQAVRLAPPIPPATAPRLPYTFFSDVTRFDYYTGTRIYLSSTPDGSGGLFTRDHARISASGPGGGTWERAFGASPIPFQEVSRALFPNAPFSATYSIRTVLWTEMFTTYLSFAYYLTMKDTTPPEIRDAQIWPDGDRGEFSLRATVVDNCAVAAVTLIYHSSSGGGGTTGMDLVGPYYEGTGRLPRVGGNTYTIIAVDRAGNSSIWTASLPATYSGAFGFSRLKGSCPPGPCGTEGDPVNTASGNFVTRTLDLRLPGIGGTDILVERTYNAQAVPPKGDFTLVGMGPGPFGPGWSWPFSFRLERVDNRLLSGFKVHYPDGRTARFADNGNGTFTPLTPGNTDTLRAVPGGYVLKQKDLTEYHFDGAGKLVRVVDPNGNTQTLAYDGAERLVRVENNAGRWIEIAYTAEGLIAEIRAPEGVRLRYGYTGGLLTTFTDARGQTWQYEYDEAGRLKAILTPRGHPALRLRYDEWGRVVEQVQGATARRTFIYDDWAHTRTIVDAYGHRTVHQYDDRYRLVRVTDPLGSAEEYGYDDQDRRVYFQDKEGRRWRYVYDERGNLIHEYGPLGWERSWAYNEMDRLILERDPAGRQTRYGYDERGNLTVITNALGFTQTFTYDPRGLPVRFTDFNGHPLTNTYDAAGNLIATENGVGAVTRYGYDSLGRTVAMTTPNGAVYTYTYDGGSPLLTGLHGPPGYRETYAYDANGNLARKVDPNGNGTRYEYDDADRLVAEVNAPGFTTLYTYGLMNETVAVQDAEGRITTYEYDPLLRLTAVHAPEGATTRYAYDGVGNLVAETDPEGRITRYVYNDLDRLIERVQNFIPGGPQNADTNVRTRYEYDRAGNLIRVVDPNGVATCYEYDGLNRLRAEIRHCRPGEPPGPDVNVTTRYEYDPHGNLLRWVNPRGFATTYAYDAAHRLIGLTDPLSQTTAYAYDLNGNLTRMTDAGGIVTRYEYDLLDRRVAEIRHHRPGEPPGPDVNVTTRYEYDPAGNLIQMVDPNGVATCYEYDALNRLTAEIRHCRPGEPADPQTNVATRYEYDRVGNLIRLTNPNGPTTVYAYDGLNRRIARTDPGGHTATFAYDRLGNLLRRTDPRGFSTHFARDGLYRVITVTDALGGTTLFAYDPAGNLVALTDPNGHTTRYGYDGLYRLAAVTDPEGFVTRSEYDPNGNRVALIDANGNRTTFAYDPLDRLEAMINGEGETTRYRYDAVGNQTDLIEPDGVVTRYEYDGLYRLAAVILNYRPGAPADHQTNVAYRYRYDPNGNRVEVRLPPNGAAPVRTLTYAYDPLNRLVAERDPLGNTWRYDYDAAGNLIRRTDAAGRVTTYTYDADHLLVRMAYDDGFSVAFAYDENHNRTVMTDSLGVTRWTYDPLNRVTRVADSLGRALEYAYDPAGNRVALVYPDGGMVRYDYDANNRLRAVADPAGMVTRWERDGVGNLRRQVNPNGTLTEAAYDRANRLRALTHRRLDGTLIAAFAYEVNAVGLRTVMTATYGWRNPPVVVERYAYDPLRRLTGVTDGEGFQAVYAYDAAGNRTRWWANDDQTTQRPRDGFEVTYTYDGADRLLEAVRVGGPPEGTQRYVYAYDPNGNRVNLNWPGPPGPNTQGVDYTYDQENRLLLAQAYQTNHRGHRTDREVTRLFYDGLGRRLAKEYDPRTGAGGVKRTEYVFDGLDPIVEYTLWNGQREELYRGGPEGFSPTPLLLTLRRFPEGTQGQTYWYHPDGRGSVAGVTKHLGQSTHNYRYDAYGQLLPAQGNWTDPHNHYTFGGKEWDEHLRLYEFGVRLYDPWAGVWLSREPLAGVPLEPRTWHRYQYAFASPLSYYDPYGLQVPPDWLNPLSRSIGERLDRLSYSLGEGLDRLSYSLGERLDRLSYSLGEHLDRSAQGMRYLMAPVPTGASCIPSMPGYSPQAANAQAVWILYSWFFEIGPEVQRYGPESPFTQILRHHSGVQRAREAWKAAGYPPVFPPDRPYYPFRIEETANTPWEAFVRENITMLLSFAGFGSPTPEGPINPLGGVVGSYDIQIRDLGNSTALFIVKNETDWRSGTRIPGTDHSLLPVLTRSETDVFTVVGFPALVSAPLHALVSPPLAPLNLATAQRYWELSQITPGGLGGIGGRMTQYYYWVELIPEEEPCQGNGFC